MIGSLAFAALILFQMQYVSASDLVDIPEEELATESVLPVFDNAKSVLNRNITTKNRFELGGGVAFVLNEPFYSSMTYGVTGTYHLNEVHGIQLTGNFWTTGLSQYGEQLKNGEGLLVGQRFDVSLAPQPKALFLANYQFTAFYGKISITKKTVMNLSTHGLAGLGVMQFDGSSPIVLTTGFGQRFYFTSRFALRWDLRLLMFQGPDPTSKSLQSPPAPSPSSFDDTLYLNTFLGLGAVFLI